MFKKLLYLILISVLVLSGCEKKSTETADADVFRMDGETTASGVAVGDGPSEFKKAYSRYEIQVAWNDTDSSYMIMSPNEIPYDEEISTLIATLFIDGTPQTPEEVGEANEISPEDVPDLLSSADYLHAHEVIYRYLDFDWSEGIIASISSEELNFNESFEIPKLG